MKHTYQTKLQNIPPNIKLVNYIISRNNEKMEAKKPEVKSKDSVDELNPLKPLFYIMRIFSIDPSETNTFLRRFRGVILSALLTYASYCSVVGRMEFLYSQIPNIVKVTDIFGLTVDGGVCIYNILKKSFSNGENWKENNMKCQLIDDLLDVEKKALSKFQKLWSIKLIIIIIILSITSSTFDFVTYTIAFHYSNSSTFIMNYLFTFVNALEICHFIAQLHILWGKFYLLNEHLGLYSEFRSVSLKERYNYVESHESTGILSFTVNYGKYSKLSCESFNMNDYSIDKLMKVYMLACDLADSYNSYFGIQILLFALSSVINILRWLRIIVLFAIGEAFTGTVSPVNPLIAKICRSLFVIFLLFTIISSCDFTTSEAKRTSLILDTVLYNTCSETSKDTQKLEAWSQLMVRRSPHFTACKMFPINYELLVAIIGTVVTYFIILVQIE